MRQIKMKARPTKSIIKAETFTPQQQVNEINPPPPPLHPPTTTILLSPKTAPLTTTHLL